MADRQGTEVLDQAKFLRVHQQLAETDFVLNFIEKANAYRDPLQPMWRELEDNRLVASPLSRGGDAVPFIGSTKFTTATALKQPNPRRRTRSNLKDPKSLQVHDTNLAQAMTLLLSSPDYLSVIPVGSDDVEKARYLARLMMGIIQSPGVYRTMYGIFDAGWSFGAGIMQLGWETRSRVQAVMRPVIDPDTGMVIGREQDVAEVVWRDGPMIQQVDRFDFWTDPSGTRIQEDMLGVVKRFRISTHHAREMMNMGVYKKDATMRAIAHATDSGESNYGDEYERRLREVSIETATDYGMMTGFEFWGESPVSKPRNRVITLLEGEHVRSHLNPYIDGRIPFKEFVPNPIPGRFDGLSPLEAIRFIQDAADGMLMGLSDAYDLAYRNVILKGSSAQCDPTQLRERRPNSVIDVSGNIDAIKPLPFDSGSLVGATNHYLMLGGKADEAAGSLDPLQNAPDRATATHVAEVVRLASAKTEMSVQLIERNDMPWLGETLHSRLRQFMSPEQRQILAGERFPVTLEEIDFDADVRFVGSRQATSKHQKVAGMREALNVLSTNPQAVRAFPDVYIRYFRELDIVDAEQVVQQAIQFLEQQEQKQIALQQQMEAQKGSTVSNTTSDETFGSQAGETEKGGVALG